MVSSVYMLIPAPSQRKGSGGTTADMEVAKSSRPVCRARCARRSARALVASSTFGAFTFVRPPLRRHGRAVVDQPGKPGVLVEAHAEAPRFNPRQAAPESTASGGATEHFSRPAAPMPSRSTRIMEVTTLSLVAAVVLRRSQAVPNTHSKKARLSLSSASSTGRDCDPILTTTVSEAGSITSHWPWMPMPQNQPLPLWYHLLR